MSIIDPHYRSVQQLLKNASFSIDEYQREYKWEKRHVDELLDDLCAKFWSCYRPGDETPRVAEYEGYFLGSIIVSKRGGKSYLVDGQQRITSLTLLLIYLYRRSIDLKLPVRSQIEPLIFSDSYGQPKFNLDIPEREPVIRALFEDQLFNTDGHDESIQTMHARYCDILERDLQGELEAAFTHFIYWLMGNVGLIEIATDNDTYAYAIFETMNDRGKPLSPVDMLKAFLLAPIGDAATRKSINQVWKREVHELASWGGEQDAERDSACIKAWLRAQYADSTRERKAGASDRDWELIGSAFHRWTRDNTDRLGVGKERENIRLMSVEFPFFAKAYKKILDASRSYTPGLEAVFYNAHNEFTWQNTVLLAPLDPADNDDTVRRKLAATATYLDIWLMRRAANYIRVGYSSTAYAMFLLCRDIRRKPLEGLVAILKSKLEADDVSFVGAPSRGRRGIDGLGLNQFSRRYIYHMLARLTAHIEAQSGRPDLFDQYVDRERANPCDIEHIWADDYDRYKSVFPTREEFHTARDNVAALLLLPADVNRSLQDKDYVDKVVVYARQNLYAASLSGAAYEHQPQFKEFRARSGLPFKPYGTFGKAEQAERTALVKALANDIWSTIRLDAF
ncbi:DUF262 domain-containing protein [Methylocystis sp. JAN1]|uniref:DUF262 domain-containing protein n=1 Tax=Methylocystis sp. JAN1 TaxID=3397211 RepID=UPI003FA28B04